MSPWCVLCAAVRLRKKSHKHQTGCMHALTASMRRALQRLVVRKKTCQCRGRQWVYVFWGIVTGWHEVGFEGPWLTSPKKPRFEPHEKFVPKKRVVTRAVIERDLQRRRVLEKATCNENVTLRAKARRSALTCQHFQRLLL